MVKFGTPLADQYGRGDILKRLQLHKFALILLAAVSIARADEPAPVPAPEAAQSPQNGLVQSINDARLKLFDWVRTKPWVDRELVVPRPKGDGSANANSGNGSASGSSGSGNGSGNGSGTGGGAGSGSASAGNGSGSGSGSGSGGEEDHHDGDGHNHTADPNDPTGDLPTPPAQVVAGNANSKAFAQWYPMCLFIDPDAIGGAAANATVKGLVDDAAKCSVNLVVYPVTVKPGSYPAGDPEGTNALQTAACNLGGRLDNAARASTSICVNEDQMSDKMCKQICSRNAQGGPGPDCGADGEHKVATGGCAQVNSGAGEAAVVQKYKDDLAATRDDKARTPAERKAAGDRLTDIEEHMKGGSSTGSSIAPSIEDKGSCTAGTVGHEAIGHSMFGHPNGGEDGHGIGLAETGGGNGWSEKGCAAMRRNAFPNSGKWRYDPNRTTYYVQVPPARQWDLQSGKQVLGPTIRPPLPGGRTPPDVGGGTGQVVFDDSATKSRPQKPADQVAATEPPTGNLEKEKTGPEGRHKGKQPGSVSGELVENLKEAAEPPSSPSGDQPPPNDVFVKSKPGPVPGNASAARVTFDDGAKKGAGKYTDYGTAGRVGDFGSASVGYNRGPASAGGGGRTSVGFDDSAKKGGGGYTSYGGGSGGSSGEGGNVAGEGTAVPIIPAGASSGLGQLDGNFFNTLGQADQERRKAEAARERRPAVVQEDGGRRTSGDKRALTR